MGGGAEILSLAGDYLGYVETPEQMERAAGETPRTYFGPELEKRLETAAVMAAAEARQAILKLGEKAAASGTADAGVGAAGAASTAVAAPRPSATP